MSEEAPLTPTCAHTGPYRTWAVHGARLAQQAWVRPLHLLLVGESAGSAGVCGGCLWRRHWKLAGRLAWRCWGQWRPWWDPGVALGMAVRLLADGTSCASGGSCRGAVAQLEDSRFEWHRCRALYWFPYCCKIIGPMWVSEWSDTSRSCTIGT